MKRSFLVHFCRETVEEGEVKADGVLTTNNLRLLPSGAHVSIVSKLAESLPDLVNDPKDALTHVVKAEVRNTTVTTEQYCRRSIRS